MLVSMNFGEGNSKSPTEAKNTIKDNAQAGIPAKRDFLVFLFIIVGVSFYKYVTYPADLSRRNAVG